MMSVSCVNITPLLPCHIYRTPVVTLMCLNELIGHERRVCLQCRRSQLTFLKSIDGRRDFHSTPKHHRPTLPENVQNTLIQTMSRVQEIPAKLKQIPDSTRIRVANFMENYEEFIGIKQVKEAHSRVLEAETRFMKSQDLRRDALKELNVVQHKLRDIHSELDRTARGDDRYLELIKREMTLIKEERSIREKFDDLEKQEREHFNSLSNALRFSHEKERAQNEKTKYWSVVGSLIGGVVGVVGSTINSRMRMAKMEQMLAEKNFQSISILQDQLSILADKVDALASNSLVEGSEKLENLNSSIMSLSKQLEIQPNSRSHNASLLSDCDSKSILSKDSQQKDSERRYLGYFFMIAIPLVIFQILKG